MTTRLHPHQHDRYRRMPRYFWLFAALQLLAALTKAPPPPDGWGSGFRRYPSLPPFPGQ